MNSASPPPSRPLPINVVRAEFAPEPLGPRIPEHPGAVRHRHHTEGPLAALPRERQLLESVARRIRLADLVSIHTPEGTVCVVKDRERLHPYVMTRREWDDLAAAHAGDVWLIPSEHTLDHGAQVWARVLADCDPLERLAALCRACAA